MRLHLTIALTVALSAALSASDYFGQVTFNGLPVPGVSVTATQTSNRATAITNQDGIYQLADLADGVWNLTIEMLGFATITREITVPASADPPADILTVRSLDELEHVVPAHSAFARVPLTSSSTLRVESLASASDRSTPIDLTVLAGTGSFGAEDGLLINGSLNNGASTPFALPRAIGNNRPRTPSVFSYAAGLQLGNSAWDARPFSLSGVHASKPSYTDVRALGTIEGPVRVPWLRNAITVNIGYQGSSATSVNTQFARVPTDRERAGDFSHTLDARGQPVRIVDPINGQPFAGNAIPIDRISPQAAALLAYYPHADPASTGRFNYQAPLVDDGRQNGVRARAAYAITDRNRINIGGSYQSNENGTTSLFGFTDTRDSSAGDAQGMWQLRPTRYTTIELRYQFLRGATESIPYFANRIDVSGAAGINGGDRDARNWGPPSLTFASDLAGLTDGRYASAVSHEHVWGANVSRFHGTHTLAFGGELHARLNNVVQEQNPRGTFSFTGAASGVDVADFLLGLPHTSAIGFGNADKRFRSRSYAAHATDDWKIRPSLTLALGVRWEYESPVDEAQGRLANLEAAPDFAFVSQVVPGDVGALSGARAPRSLVRADRGGPQPRLGVAWRPSLGSSTVIRGGYGIYRSTDVYQPIASLLAAQPPFSTTFNVATNPLSPLTLAHGFDRPAAASFNTFAIDPNFRVASSHTWEASIQRDLRAELTVVASYIGTRGTHLMQQFLPNTFAPGTINPCPSCPTGFRYLTSNGRSRRHAAQFQLRRRLSTGFTATTQYTIAKAMDNAAAFGGATLDSSALAQNWLDLDAEYARSNFDQRHLFSASFEYTSGSGVRGGTLLEGWRGRLVKDWTFVANLSTGSGRPLSPVYFAPIGGTGIIGTLRPDLTGAPSDSGHGSYASAAAYAAPAPGQWGNAPRNSITGPSTFTLNAAISRTFRLNSRVNFDWRIDAANVLNRVTYASVNTLITSPEFGLPNRTNDMRTLRSSIRVRF
jgi:hypothetical protein